jgi:hypothetical protein
MAGWMRSKSDATRRRHREGAQKNKADPAGENSMSGQALLT